MSGNSPRGRYDFEDIPRLNALLDHDLLLNWVANKHINWTNATDNLLTTGSGRFDGGIGIGTDPIAALPLRIVTSHADSTAIRIDNTGAGDPVVQFALDGTVKYVMGIDDSDSDKFKLSSGTTLGTPTLIMDSSINLSGIGTVTSGAINTLHIVPGTTAGHPVWANYVNLSGDGTEHDGLSIQIPYTAGNDFYYGYGGTEDHYFGQSSDLQITSDGNIATAGTIGSGAITSTGKIQTTLTTEQLRLSYDVDNWVAFTVDDGGILGLQSSIGYPVLDLTSGGHIYVADIHSFGSAMAFNVGVAQVKYLWFSKPSDPRAQKFAWFNNTYADIDFIVSGDNDANLIYTDAENDRVGIGTATPAAKLDVVGAALISTTLGVTGEALFSNKVKFTQPDGAEYIDSLADGYMDYGATTGHRFNTDKLVVLATGRVGIGTATPNAPLEVKGAKPAGNIGGFQSGMLHVTGTGTAEFSNSVITGHSAYDTNTQLWYLGSITDANNNIAFINRQNAAMHFYTNNASRMTIDAAGNVGLGTTTPQATLDVTGDVLISTTLGVTGVATLGDSSQMATSAAPTADADIANKKYVDDSVVASAYSGNYTGDGTESKAIAGVGFTPKYVKITDRKTVNGNAIQVYWTNSDIIDDNAFGGAIRVDNDGIQTFAVNAIISFDADGFTVDDGAADDHPNKDGITYNFICMG